MEMPSSESTSETIILRGPQDKLGLGKFLSLFFRNVVSVMIKNFLILVRVCDLMSLSLFLKLLSHNDASIWLNISCFFSID